MASISLLDQPVLVLNAFWQPLGETTVQYALVDMTGGGSDGPSKMGMNVELERDPVGNLVMRSGTRAVDWDEWLTLPIREDIHKDRALHTHRIQFRCPTVVICTSYDKMPTKSPRLSAGNIWDRDGGICQYTGRKLPRAQLNIDHVVPRDRGGRDEWTNLVLSDREINSRKGNRLNSEVGLRLIRAPQAPKPVPASLLIRTAKHITWEPFLIARN